MVASFSIPTRFVAKFELVFVKGMLRPIFYIDINISKEQISGIAMAHKYQT